MQEGIDQRQSIVADKVQFVPQLIEPRGLCVVEHQPLEMIVLAIEQRQRDDLIDRHDLRVTQRRREPASEFIERRLDSLPRFAPLPDNDRRRVRHAAIVRCPRAIRVRLDGRRRSQAGGGLGLRRQHLQLHASLLAGLGVQRPRDNELGPRDEVRRETNLNHRRSLHTQARRFDAAPVGMLPEQRGIKPDLRTY